MPRRIQSLFSVGFLTFLFLAVLYISANVRSESIMTLTSKYEEPEYESYGQIIGIDLGNDVSRVAIRGKETLEIITDDQGRTTTPSYVAFTNEGTLVGFEAKNQAASNPKNTIYDIRRIIGRKFSDRNFQRDIEHLPYDVLEHKGKLVIKVQIDGSIKLLTPEEILAKIIAKLKTDAEAYLGESIKKAVVSVPPYFTDAQRQATKDAGSLAGLGILRLVNEPVAAGIAHGFDHEKFREEINLLVYKVEEREVDVSLTNVESCIFEILSNARDNHQGGKDYDPVLLNFVVDQYNIANDTEITKDPGILDRLKYEVQKAEKTLLTDTSAQIQIQAQGNSPEFSLNITATEYRELDRKIFERSLPLINKALVEAKVKKTEINEIIMIGEPEYVSKMQPFVEEYFDGKKASAATSPDEAVVHGVAAQGFVLSGLDGFSCSLSTFDMASLSLGIETSDGRMTKIIHRNTIIPTRKTVIFSTATDNQAKIVLDVYEGDWEVARKNKLLHTLTLAGIPPAPKGVPRIEVRFEIDTNYILTVVAEDKETGKEAKSVFAWETDQYSRGDIEAGLVAAEEFNERYLTEKKLGVDAEVEIPYGVIIRG